MKKRVIKLDGRYRLFFIELYKDTESYVFDDVLRNLKSLGNYAYIEHNNDFKEDGTKKKEHIHFILKLDNAMSGSAFVKKTGVPLSFCQEIINERSCIRYLVHYDDDDKTKYNINDIKCSGHYQRFINKAFSDVETEEQIICNIYNFINDIVPKVKTRSNTLFYLVQYVNSNCYDSVYKRYRQEFNSYLTDLL